VRDWYRLLPAFFAKNVMVHSDSRGALVAEVLVLGRLE